MEETEYRPFFETFKEKLCRHVRSEGDIGFLIEVFKSDKILYYLKKGWYREALYLLALVDYLCRDNGFPLHEDYEEARKLELSETLYPADVIISCAMLKSDNPKEESLREAIPEFLRHNIVEWNIRNIA